MGNGLRLVLPPERLFFNGGKGRELAPAGSHVEPVSEGSSLHLHQQMPILPVPFR